MGGKTLSGRLFLLSSIWAILSIALIALIISSVYRNNTEKRLAELLTANLYNLMGSIEPDDKGKLSGIPDLRDARYQKFRSGYYWSVHEIADTSNRLASVSLADETITHSQTVSFDDNFQRQFTFQDAANNQMVGVEAHVFLGEGDNLFSFQITANKGDIDQEVSRFVRQLLILLTIFALGLVLVTYFLVRYALKPLREISEGLADIRDGKTDRLEGDFPLEIQPLVDETNSLIKSNNSVIERARTQVGNLAHSLKTPLAVLQNEADKAPSKLKGIIEQQTDQMRSHVQSYLDRAQIAARSGSVTSRTELKNAIERMVRVMGKLNPNLTFQYLADDDGLIFSGEQQDFEELLGNLLENAAKFADEKVYITAKYKADQENPLLILIEDDGPGIKEEHAQKALSRGVRLDETKPGSGLGLSIVKDITKEYGGSIALSASQMGGLKVELHLPGKAK